jgi:magnesium transporter
MAALYAPAGAFGQGGLFADNPVSMLTAFILFADGRVSTDTSPASLTAALRDPKARFWLDMSAPTDEELGLLDDVFGFHPLAIEDTIGYSQRPKIESYNHIGDACDQGYFYMVIHGPDLASFREKLRTKELDMFVSERYLVTVRDETMKSVDDLLQRGRLDPRYVLSNGIDILLHQLLDHLVDHYSPILEYLQEEIDSLEEQAVSDPKPQLLTEISLKKRELLGLRRIIAPQREVIAQLTRGEVPFIRETTRIYFRDVLDHLNRAVELIELYRDLIVGARDIYLSSVSNNLNNIMKTLTMISVIALPMTVITSFFGMNFDDIPGLHSKQAFWLTVALMFAIVGGLIYVFRIRKWL